MEFLHDYSFLKQLDTQLQKVLYIRIEVLDWLDQPIATIDGTCTGGSISLNAKSSMRRSGNLTMIADNTNQHLTHIDNLISINKKISISVGLENHTGQYQSQEIIWFPMGVFIISNASISKSVSGVNISITFKDKMVLLNGEVGGTLAGPITHSPIYIEDASEEAGYYTEGVPFYNLIHSLVTEFGNLPVNSVIIDDVDLRVKNPLYNKSADIIWVYKQGEQWEVSLTDPGVEGAQSFSFGENLAYQYTDFIYPLDKELTSGAGESVESVLKKITAQLANHEYFFDVNGIFHFQEIKNGLHQGSELDDLTSALGDKYLAERQYNEAIYTFDNDELFTAVSSNPTYPNIKNAFVVWGQDSGSKLELRYHLIIDTPPTLSRNKTYNFFTKTATYLRRIGISDTATVSYIRGYGKQVSGAQAASITLSPEDDWRLILYYELLTGGMTELYGKEYIEEFPKQFDIVNKQWLVPESERVYHLDMLDPLQVSHPIVAQLGVDNIGYRLLAEKKDEINSVLPGIKIPDVILISTDSTTLLEEQQEAKNNNQPYALVSDEIMNKTALGNTKYSGYDYVRSLMHNSVSYLDTVNISCIPIYYLEPNQRIHIDDPDTGVKGDYIIQSMSIPLTVDGVMAISATRAIEMI